MIVEHSTPWVLLLDFEVDPWYIPAIVGWTLLWTIVQLGSRRYVVLSIMV
jgi:hypothetical protein